MIVLKKIVTQIQANENSKIIIDKLGVVNKIVGNNFILSPFCKEIEGISLIIKSNKVISIKVTLYEDVLFKELIDEFSKDYYLGFNNFDYESVISLNYRDLIVRAIKSGYIEKENLKFLTFKRFEIRKK